MLAPNPAARGAASAAGTSLAQRAKALVDQIKTVGAEIVNNFGAHRQGLVDTHATELQDLQQQLTTAQTQAQDLQRQLTAAQTQVTDLTTMNQTLSTELQQANAALATTQRELADANTQFDTVELEFDSLKQGVESFLASHP